MICAKASLHNNNVWCNWSAGELAGVSLQCLESLHGDTTAQWLYRLARGCDTEEVC